MKKVKQIEFYKVGYYLDKRQTWACYFNLESAQEAMMKMIKRGMNITEMTTQIM